MNLIELQIEFQRKIVDVNLAFKEDLRPDTYTIVSYLNRAIKDYLKNTFLNLPTYQQQLIAIDTNSEDLRFLFKRGQNLLYPYAMDYQNWGARAKRYRAPDDFMIPISLGVTISRSEVAPMTNDKMFVEFVSRRQAENLINDSSDKVIHVQPCAYIEDEFYIVIVGDAYVTSIAAGEFTYLRKPDILSFDYQELTHASTLDISTIPTGTYMRALSPLTYVNATPVVTSFIPGDKVEKIAGYHSMTSLGGEPVKIGYPWGETDTPDFPEYRHEDILERSTQLFLDEAKLKLVSKQS